MQSLLGIVKWAILVITLLFWLVVSLANRGMKMPFKFIPGTFEWESFPVSSMILLSIAFAYIVFFIVGILENFENMIEKRSLRKHISDLERELKELRNEPIRRSSTTDRIAEEEQKK
ncbi:MAG: hypothetical protein N2445_06590 [Acidobacteria bacterium]|nr:hypothetical protein [Acidobacteriota bacterium]